jgi:predicted DsbA family dithiol-disulfide isomerase
LDFDFQWTDESRMHNTFNTHQLLAWAETLGRKHDLKMALFTAHFTHRRNLSDDSVLADVAAEIGLDRDEAVAVLDDQRFAAEVRQGEQFWQQQGISGVPAVVFDRQHLVTGAQGVDNYQSILNQLAQMKD